MEAVDQHFFPGITKCFLDNNIPCSLGNVAAHPSGHLMFWTRVSLCTWVLSRDREERD